MTALNDDRGEFKSVGPQPRRRRRRRYGYCSPIERRAALAAGMIKGSGWTVRQAAGAFAVNPGYISIAKNLGIEDRLRLSRGEIKLSDLWKEYRARLAERRLAAEREALDAKLDLFIAQFGADRVMAALDRVTAPNGGNGTHV